MNQSLLPTVIYPPAKHNFKSILSPTPNFPETILPPNIQCSLGSKVPRKPGYKINPCACPRSNESTATERNISTWSFAWRQSTPLPDRALCLPSSFNSSLWAATCLTD